MPPYKVQLIIPDQAPPDYHRRSKMEALLKGEEIGETGRPVFMTDYGWSDEMISLKQCFDEQKIRYFCRKIL